MAIRALLFASVLLFFARLATAEFEGRRLLTEDDYHTEKTRRILATTFKCDDVFELTIDEIQVLIFNKALTSLALVKCYVQRIADYSNPATFNKTKAAYPVNAIMEMNPILYKVAAAKDMAYAIKCKHAKAPACLGPMHGIPVILKDNVAADHMQNTAGSLALLGCSHVQSTIASKLAKRGAIILAKAGLSEWANYRGLSVSGWSGRIGQVACPYVHYVLRNITVLPAPYPNIPAAIAPGNYTNVLNPTIVSGSSSGSAAAAATSLGTITVGSETSGSILSPSNANGLVGLKPTVGLVSRFGVIPLSHSQDTAGPMGRTVTDVAYLLTALAGFDGGDEDTITQQQVSTVGHYESFLNASAFSGKTFAALALNLNFTDPKVVTAYNSSINAIIALGATVDVYTISPFFNITSALVTNLILPTDFKQDIAAYMAGCTWKKGYTPMYTLADLITFNKVNYMKEFQGGAFANLNGKPNPAYGNFFQQTWEFAQTTVNLYDPAYLAQKLAAANLNAAITAFFTGSNPYNHTYSAFIHTGNFTGTWATTRNPSITVPMTTTSLGLPQGIYFSGLAYSEQTLISLGYAFEQKVSMGKRPLPTFCNSYKC